MTEIIHIAFLSQWADAQAGSPYRASGRDMTVAQEGFVHCAFPHQVADVLSRYYRDVDPTELTALVLDTRLIEADGVKVLFEDTQGVGEKFPHVYGELRPSWVTGSAPVAK